MTSPRRQDFHAFTVRFGGVVSRIVTEVALSDAFDPADPPDPLPKTIATTGLWDTGASRTVVTPNTVRALGLTPVGQAPVNHAGGRSIMPTYMVNLLLPNRVGAAGVLVTECSELVGDVGALIGMDIITLGDFSVTNVNGVTTFTFRTPSVAELDYAAQATAIREGRPGRNEACPCGSGRKYKQCHGSGPVVVG